MIFPTTINDADIIFLMFVLFFNKEYERKVQPPIDKLTIFMERGFNLLLDKGIHQGKARFKV